NKKRALVVIASLVAAGGVGSVAFGYWTQSGAGTGSATTGTTSTALQVSQATASGVMPGVPVALSGTIANSNSATVRVSGLTGVVSVTSPATGCNAAWFSVTGTPTFNGASAPADIAGNTTTTTWAGLQVQLNEGG